MSEAPNGDDALTALRQRIDAIDQQLLDLLSARARAAQEVAAVKTTCGDAHFYRPEREAQVLRTVKERNPGPLAGEEMARLFREIMSACLALEQPIKVAFLGPEGTFTQAAAAKHFGHHDHQHKADAGQGVHRDLARQRPLRPSSP